MELYATGFNAHNQLQPLPPSSSTPQPRSTSASPDILTFQKIAQGTSIRVLCALWSATVLAITSNSDPNSDSEKLIFNGFHNGTIYSDEPIAGLLRARDVKTVFGDTSGVLGALGFEGSLWRFGVGEGGKGLGFVRCEGLGGWCGVLGGEEEEEGEEEERGGGECVIDQIAIADNGEVCVVTYPKSSSTSTSFPDLSPSNKNITLLHTFPAFSSLLTTTSSPSSPSLKSTHPHLLPSLPTTLLASSTSFTSLHNNNHTSSQILTWGSPLHSHLGRTPLSAADAAAPGPVAALGGIQIRKIATRGWMTAALSCDNEGYVWGGRPTGEEGERIEALRMGRGGEDVVLLEVRAGGERGEEEEGEEDKKEEEGIIDIAMGENHIIALTSRGEIYVVGDGKWGQLGTGKRDFEREWVKVEVEVDGIDVLGNGARRKFSADKTRTRTRSRKRIVGVECGFWSSFVLVGDE